MEYRKKPKVFKVATHWQELLVTMKTFYRCSTQQQWFELITLMSMLDIAGLSENSSWSEAQRTAWKQCRQAARDLHRSLLLSGAKRVLDKQPPDTKLSIPELMKKAEKELENAGH